MTFFCLQRQKKDKGAGLPASTHKNSRYWWVRKAKRFFRLLSKIRKNSASCLRKYQSKALQDYEKLTFLD